MESLPLHYAFAPHEKIDQGVVRILDEMSLCGQIVARGPRASLDELVHAGRLLIKRLRALLWFARPALTRASYARAKIKLRKAAGLLSEHRDLSVTRATLDRLAEEESKIKRQRILQQASQILAGDEKSGKDVNEKMRQSLRQAVAIFRQSVKEIKEDTMGRDAWPAPTDRMEKAIRSAHFAGKQARDSEKDIDYHTWRKKAKRLLYQLELTQADPENRMKQAMKKVEKLQDKLGTYHDVVVVEERLRRRSPRPVSATKALRLLEEQKAHLRKRTRKINKRVEVSL
jgi:CHAD domain-containing protein